MIIRFLYFIVGLVYLPIHLVSKAITYTEEMGEKFVKNIQYCRQFDKNLKIKKKKMGL